MATVFKGEFEWDTAKAVANERKHGVTFEEAVEVFLDELATYAADTKFPDRVVAVGMSRTQRLLYVVFVERTERGTIRIVSARRATKPETRRYEEG